MAIVVALLDSVHPLIWSSTGFLAGAYVQHLLQVGRDRRLALEAAKIPVREWVVEQEMHEWTLVGPPMPQLDAFESRLAERKRKRFEAARDQLADAFTLDQDQQTGETSYVIDQEEQAAALRELLELTKPA